MTRDLTIGALVTVRRDGRVYVGEVLRRTATLAIVLVDGEPARYRLATGQRVGSSMSAWSEDSLGAPDPMASVNRVALRKAPVPGWAPTRWTACGDGGFLVFGGAGAWVRVTRAEIEEEER